MTTSDILAVGFGAGSLILGAATYILHAVEAEKVIQRITGTIAALAIVSAAGAVVYALVKNDLHSTPGQNCASALVGSWSGTYKAYGSNFRMGMSITSPGGDRLKAYMSFSMGPLDGSDTMTGTCSGTSVNLNSPDGDLTGTQPTEPRNAFSGEVDFGFSANFTVNQ
jgi:hypothetical protein